MVKAWMMAGFFSMYDAEAMKAGPYKTKKDAVEAGLKVLRRGGSAADAAVAVQVALGLVEPQRVVERVTRRGCAAGRRGRARAGVTGVVRAAAARREHSENDDQQ